jgi:Predicted phosphohydrolases
MFFLIMVAILLSLNSYVFVRALQSLPHIGWLRVVFSILFWGMLLSFFVRMFVNDAMPIGLATVMSAVGFTWIIAFIYFAIFILCIDVLRIVNHFFDIYPQWIKDNYQLTKLILFGVAIVAVGLLFVIGNYKYNHPEAVRLDIAIDKPIPGEGLKLVVISDVHLGSNINKAQLKRYVEMINAENSDLILIAGDLCDMSARPMIEQNMREELSALKSKYGVYFASGNHEFYGGDRDAILGYLSSSGINVLIDSVVTVGDIVTIAGRDDRTNTNRKDLAELLKDIDMAKPLILLDHQPYNLTETEKAGVDLQLSGHTHNGQFWPGNIVVKMMYELPYGYMQKGSTHYYVSSGLGLWGPKYRIGTVSEMVVIRLLGASY